MLRSGAAGGIGLAEGAGEILLVADMISGSLLNAPHLDSLGLVTHLVYHTSKDGVRSSKFLMLLPNSNPILLLLPFPSACVGERGWGLGGYDVRQRHLFITSDC